MSRRRELPPVPEGYTRTFTVAVICTDRGQHPKAVIANLTEAASTGTDAAPVIWQQTEHDAPVTDWRPADGTRTFRFACPRCGRDVRLREPNVLAAIGVLREAAGGHARPVLDISAIC